MPNDHYVDPNWCRENPEEAAARLAEECQANDDLRDVIEKLKQERNEYKQAAEHYVPQAQALAAHVVEIKETLEDTRDTVYRALCVIEDGPNVSLARLKAQWQAEALDRVETKFRSSDQRWLSPITVANILGQESYELRQAEESPHG